MNRTKIIILSIIIFIILSLAGLGVLAWIKGQSKTLLEYFPEKINSTSFSFAGKVLQNKSNILRLEIDKNNKAQKINIKLDENIQCFLLKDLDEKDFANKAEYALSLFSDVENINCIYIQKKDNLIIWAGKEQNSTQIRKIYVQK